MERPVEFDLVDELGFIAKASTYGGCVAHLVMYLDGEKERPPRGRWFIAAFENGVAFFCEGDYDLFDKLCPEEGK